MRSDIFFRNAASFAADVVCFAAAGGFAGAALDVAATGSGAEADFAALIAAQRFFVAAIIAFLPAAVSFRFGGETCSTDGRAFRPEPGNLPFRFGGP